MTFTCPIGGAVSHHPGDAVERYCGRCGVYVDLLLKMESSGLGCRDLLAADALCTVADVQRALGRDVIADHIAETRRGLLQLVFDVQTTLMLIEQLPEEQAPSAEDFSELHRVLEFRAQAVERSVESVQGQLQGCINYALTVKSS